LLITRAFVHTRAAGVDKFVVNTHWQAQAYGAAFPDKTWAGCPIRFSHETPDALETAGGLKHAEALLPKNEPFWVYNGDILSTLPLGPALEAHWRSGNEVTMILRSTDGPLQVSWDRASGRITDIGRQLHPEREPQYLFTGIYLVEPSFLKRIPVGAKMSVVPIFIDMIRTGARLGGVVTDSGLWWDLGTREQILSVHSALAPYGAPWVAPSAHIGYRAQLRGATAIGDGAAIGGGAVLEDTIVWPGATVLPNSFLRRCIVTENALISGSYMDTDL
jgi:NDP-sugar pyrophosphorylase family protein